MRRRHVVTTLLVAVAMTAALAASGPEAGSGAPMLGIDAFNDTGGKYCVTCRAGTKPAVMAFVKTADDATKALLTELDKQYAAGQERNLGGAVVILAGDGADALQAYVKDQGLKIPAAVVAADNQQLPKWKLDQAAANTVVLLKDHKVRESLANVAAGDVGGKVAELLG